MLKNNHQHFVAWQSSVKSYFDIRVKVLLVWCLISSRPKHVVKLFSLTASFVLFCSGPSVCMVAFFFRWLLHLEIGNFRSHTLAFQSLFPWWCSKVNLRDLLATFVKFTVLSCLLACHLMLTLLLFKKRLPCLVVIFRPVGSCRWCLQIRLFWVILFPQVKCRLPVNVVSVPE